MAINSINYRNFHESDMAKFQVLYIAMVREALPDCSNAEVHKTAREWLDHMPRDLQNIVAELGGELLGFVMGNQCPAVPYAMFPHDARVAHLGELYVKPEYRKRGVARRLIDLMMFRLMEEQGATLVWGQPSQKELIRMYERRGAVARTFMTVTRETYAASAWPPQASHES